MFSLLKDKILQYIKMNQTNIVFLSGKYEEELMSTYENELCGLVEREVQKLIPALNMLNPGLLVGREILYKNHIFNVILKHPFL